MAHLKQGSDAVKCIEEAVEKFLEAEALNGERHDTQWCLGNALTSQGFLSPDVAKARDLFERASKCFAKAVDLDPGNDVYKKALEMNKRAPGLYLQIQEQVKQQQEQQQQQERKVSEQSSDYLYDVAGWVILVGLGIGLAVLSKVSAAKP